VSEAGKEKGAAGSAGGARKKSWKKRLGRKLALRLVPIAAEYYMRLYDFGAQAGNRKRLTLINIDDLIARVESHTNPTILAFWHNTIAFGPTAYEAMHGKGAVIMISRSFDGDIIEATIKRFGNIIAVRGSSSRKETEDKGGQEALAEMKELARQGYDLSITPDGPLGPRYKVKRGIIELARDTGLPIVPIGCNSSRYLKINSWDHTRLPLPFSRVVYKAGPAMLVPADADEEIIEAKRAELERIMVELGEFVEGFFKPGSALCDLGVRS